MNELLSFENVPFSFPVSMYGLYNIIFKKSVSSKKIGVKNYANSIRLIFMIWFGYFLNSVCQKIPSDFLDFQ